jgi:hypothetical protein
MKVQGVSRGICLQCYQPITGMNTEHAIEPIRPLGMDLATSALTHITDYRVGAARTVTAYPCGHQFGVRLILSNGGINETRTEPHDELPAEGLRQELCQRCARDALCSFCCGYHHWLICVRCVVEIAGSPWALKRASAIGKVYMGAQEYVVETVFCPTTGVRLPQSDHTVPVLMVS